LHRHRRRAAGALVLLAVLATGACGDDGDSGDSGDGGEDDTTAFCEARVALGDRITELEGFDLASQGDAAEARQRVSALIDALRAMLDAAPEDIRVDADTMASGLDDIEARVEDASVIELGTEVPALLAEIGGAGSDERADAVAAVNAYAEDTCD
jgi:hypothetical protein